MNNDAEVSIRFKNYITGENKLNKYAQTLQKIQSVLSSMNEGKLKQIEESGTQLKNVSKEADNAAKKFDVAFNYSVLKKFTTSLGNVYRGLVKITQKSSDFLESFNLFQVAFNGNYRSAERFMNTMTEMYGLDESWAIKTIGIFRQLANAMNLGVETGTKLSTLLTQMSVDISSLYNLDINRAASVLQSSLAGQTKPIRGATGADITQTTLQQTLNDLDIDRKIDQLSYAEKRLVIIISLTRQLSQATGDWARTIESPANQMRILSEQFNRLSRAVGNVFLPVLSKILPYLNAIVMVITEIISMIARLFGYKEDDYDYFGTMSEDVYDLVDGLDAASDSAKKLKQGLRGFDRLNNITTPTNASSGIGVGSGIDPTVMDAFNKAYDDYFGKLKNVKMQATEIRDRIMEWLGFQKHINKGNRDTYFTFKKITAGTVLGALAVGGTIFNGIKIIGGIFEKITGFKLFSGLSSFFPKIIEMIQIVKGGAGTLSEAFALEFPKLAKIPALLGKISPKLLIIIGIITAVTIAFKKLYDTNEEFRKRVDDFVNMIKTDFSQAFKDLKDVLEPFLKGTWEQLKRIWNDAIKPLAQTLIDILKPVLEIVLSLLSLIWKSVIQPMMPILVRIAENILKQISNGLKIITDIITGISTFIRALWDILKPFLEFVVKMINGDVKGAINSLLGVIDGVKKAVQKIVDWWNNLSFNKKHIEIDYNAGGGGYSYGGGGGGSKGGGGKYVPRAIGGILVNGKWQPVNYYDSGGLPPIGQMFVARENGPELVGNIGSHTAVMNNDQIVSSVAYGVADAVSRVMKNANGGTKVFNIYLDEYHKLGTYTLDQLQEMARSNGKPLKIG